MNFLIPLLVTFFVQVYVSTVVFTPPIVAADAHIAIGSSAAAVGIVTSLIYLSSVPAALFSGYALKYLGAIRVSQLCLLISSLGALLMTIPIPWVIGFGALIVGIGYGPVTPASSALLAVSVPDRLRGFVFSVKQSGVPVGGSLAGAIVPWLMLTHGWQKSIFWIAFSGFVVIFFITVISRNYSLSYADKLARSGNYNVNFFNPLKLVFQNDRLRELAISSFVFSGMQMCLGSYLVVTLISQTRCSITEGGIALSIAMAGGIVGRLAWGLIVDHWLKARTVLGFLGLVMSVSSFTLTVVSTFWSMWLVYFLSFIFGMSAVGWNGVYLSEVAGQTKSNLAGQATAGSLALTYSGVVVLPALFWLIYTFTAGYSIPFVFIGLLSFWRGSLFLLKLKANR